MVCQQPRRGSPVTNASLASTLFAEAKVVVTLGAGGVGKTTCSIAAALIGAEQGKRVGLLSIDPAKRLAQAMGLSFSSKLKLVDLPKSFTRGGSLKAAMLDQKAVFDEMVLRFSPKEKVARKILDNRLYQMVSTNLGGPLEYMALAKLEQMATSGEFDLIVLDTPPDTHAIDFLMRPNILSGFMDNKVMTWLIKPFHFAQRLGVQKIFQVGEKLMGGIAAVTGIKALNTLAEFLVLMEDVIAGFHKSGQTIDKLLRERSTRFILVTVASPAAVRSARHLMKQLAQQDFALDTLIVNQTLPAAVSTALTARASNEGISDPGFARAAERLAQREEQSSKLIATLRQDLAAGNANDPTIIYIEEQSEMIHTLEAITKMIGSWRVG